MVTERSCNRKTLSTLSGFMISNSGKVRCLLKSVVGKDLKFHQKCLDKYSHRNTLRKMLRNRSIQQEKEEESEKKVRLSAPPLRRISFRQKSFSGTIFSNCTF